MEQKYKICTKCVMDTTDPDIEFNEEGVCNHCIKSESIIKHMQLFDKEVQKKKFSKIVEEINQAGKHKKYDCIIGVSGGVDSTYVAYVVKKAGLRPLAVHLDNGWNSELSVSNIEKTLKALDIDLYTEVLDWEEFKDLQLSFLKASVPHCEHPTDHAITAILYKLASINNIKYIILGSNISTESYGVKSWSGGQRDWRYIKSIHKIYGNTKLKSYPRLSGLKLFFYKYIKGIKAINILDYVAYVKEEAMSTIQNELGWQYYGGKHYESIYTRFFQTYILPRKFNIDKRKIHLSPLIASGQITREDALVELKKEMYPENLIQQDKEFVIKKLGISENEFDEIMDKPVKTFWDYPSYENSWWFKYLYPLFRRKHSD